MEEENEEERGTLGLADLPDEILRQIFRRLCVYTVLTRVALTCKRFYEISANVSFFKCIRFDPRFSSEKVTDVLKGVPLLKRLELYARRDVNSILEQAVDTSTKLTVLKINSGKEQRVSELSSILLLNFLARRPGLKRLVLKRASFDDEELFFGGLCAAAPELTSLNLNHNLQMSTENLMDIATGYRYLEDLRIYCLSFDRLGSVTPYEDPPVRTLLMKGGSRLRVLKLNTLGLSDASMEAVACCRLLEKLHLYRLVNVGDDGLWQVGALEELRELVVTVPRAVTRAGWLRLLAAPALSSLSKLTVSNSCTLDDDVLAVVASNCSHINWLGLPGCRQITDRGVSQVVRSCRRLTYLNLFSTKSSVERAFRLIPHHLPHLEVLVYRPADQRLTTLPQICDIMPHLEVREYYKYL
ncbi:hypothetical protein AAG570_012279 [Ranatra chinensis]|uniref:F-box domain-containing protein n=1 Tax=Ranatra chinensis TaxID=642074 RepID=A0ABD0YIH6_9HEMI